MKKIRKLDKELYFFIEGIGVEKVVVAIYDAVEHSINVETIKKKYYTLLPELEVYSATMVSNFINAEICIGNCMEKTLEQYCEKLIPQLNNFQGYESIEYVILDGKLSYKGWDLSVQKELVKAFEEAGYTRVLDSGQTFTKSMPASDKEIIAIVAESSNRIKFELTSEYEPRLYLGEYSDFCIFKYSSISIIRTTVAYNFLTTIENRLDI